MDCNDSHPANAKVRIDETDDGKTIDVRLRQFLKASFPTSVRIFDVMSTVFKLLHPWNILDKIDVTPDGIVIDGNDSQFSKALFPIDVKEDGMFIDVRLLQP